MLPSRPSFSPLSALALTNLCAISLFGSSDVAHAQAEVTAAEAPLTAAEVAKTFATPTKITINATDAPVTEIFESMMKQANLPTKMAGTSARSDKVSLNVKEMPFWKAAQSFQKASGWGLFRGSSGRDDVPGYSLARYREGMGGLESEKGPLLGYVKSLSRTRTQTTNLDFSAPLPATPAPSVSTDLWKLSTVFYLDPKVTLVPGSSQLRLIEALDENGKAVFNPGEGSRGGDWKLEGSFSAQPNPGVGRKIARLKLGYRAFVALEPQVMEFNDVGGEGTKTKVGPRGEGVENYEISDAKATPRGYSLLLKAYRPSDGMDFHNVTDALFGQVKLIDATGKEWRGFAGMTADRAGVSNPSLVRKYEGSLIFGRPGDTFPGPLKLVWALPTRFRMMEDTLEWNDVPLP